MAVAAALLALAACTPPAQTAAPACTAPLKPALEVDLYFGREIDTGREVSEAEWASFLNDEVTPRFPDGLSVRVSRMWHAVAVRDRSSSIRRAPSRFE